MNLVYVAPFGLAPKNTTKRRLLPMARAMAARGHHVRVVVPPYDDHASYGRVWTDAGVDVTCLAAPRLGGPAGPGAAFAQFSLARQALRRLAGWQPDLVHVFKPKAVSGLIQTGLWRRRHRPPLVLDTDDWEGREGWSVYEDYPPWLVWMFDRQERAGLRRCDAITAASRELADRARALPRPVPVLHLINGYDPGAYARWNSVSDRVAGRRALGLKADDRAALVYTRFFEYPIEHWARVIRGVAARAPDVRFIVLGAGKFGQEKDLAADLRVAGLADRVNFLGWVVFDDLAAILAAADVALLPMTDVRANRAKCSVKYVDLMMAGVPVVATPVGETTAYVIDGATGVLAADDSPEAMVAATVRGLDLSDRAALVAQARAHVMSVLTWERLTEPLVEIYQTLLDRRAPTPPLFDAGSSA
ncbi:MAG: glycosyltransferase [Actinobacteria bacterium]|nr:glycosyltransferase [Actinomycetota bacterium]